MQLSNVCTAPQNRHLFELFLSVCSDLLELLRSGSGLSPSLADVYRELPSSGFFFRVLFTLGLGKVDMPSSSGMLAYSVASLMNLGRVTSFTMGVSPLLNCISPLNLKMVREFS